MSWRSLRQEFLSSGKKFRSPKNDLLLRVAKGEIVKTPPVWMMRQAGRYLPEFKEIRAENDFVKVCKDPDLASEVTIQPLTRFRGLLDAVIVFSDILTIPMALGQQVEMIPGKGPVVSPKLSTVKQISDLNFKPDIEDTLGYVFDAIFATRTKIDSEVPVIGFSGAPWSLFGYMVEGGGSKTWAQARRWVYAHPAETRYILSALNDVIVEYLVGQFDAGASILQVFDTNGGELPPKLYQELCVPGLLDIAARVKALRPEALLMVFPKDVYALESFGDSQYDVVGVSWKDDPERVRRILPGKVLQGNLDPAVLLSNDKQIIKRQVVEMLNSFGTGSHIANLGHGMMPEMNPDMARWFLEAVKERNI